jgi:predicted HTH domain antitoxin
LGYIFDIVAKVLQVKKNGGIDIKVYPRMADFAEIGEIISRGMGYQENEFLDAYHKNINMLTEEAIEAHPVAIAVVRFMKDRSGWAGTVTQLYQELVASAYDSRIDTFGKMWPKSASILSRRINEVKTILRSKGITIENYLADTSTGLRGIKLCKVQSVQSVPSENQISPQNIDNLSDGTLTPLAVQSETSKMPSESSQRNHEGISSDIPTSDCTYGTYDIVHTKDSLPSPSNGKREGIYWSGSKWYCEYCNANGDIFYMEVHDCNNSKMKNS